MRMAETLLHIDIVTPQHTAFQGTAQAVTLPGTLGPFQVLVNHAPIISSIEIGAIKIIDEDGNDIYFATDGGFAEVKNNKVSIVVETADAAGEIDIARNQSLIDQAQERYDAATDQHLRAPEKGIMHRAQNRIKVAEASRGIS